MGGESSPLPADRSSRTNTYKASKILGVSFRSIRRHDAADDLAAQRRNTLVEVGGDGAPPPKEQRNLSAPSSWFNPFRKKRKSGSHRKEREASAASSPTPAAPARGMRRKSLSDYHGEDGGQGEIPKRRTMSLSIRGDKGDFTPKESNLTSSAGWFSSFHRKSRDSATSAASLSVDQNDSVGSEEDTPMLLSSARTGYAKKQSGGSFRERRERKMSRRARNTFRGGGALPFACQMSLLDLEGKKLVDSGPVGLLRQNVLDKSKQSSDELELEDSLPSVLMKSLSETSLCNLKILCKDKVPMKAPSYLLAAHSEVFKEMFHPNPNEIELAFADHDAVQASVHFLATHSIPDGLESDVNEGNMRSVCQMYLFGRALKISSLRNQAYRMARRMMNKVPRLVCAAFDECTQSTGNLESTWHLSSSHCELKEYALDYMRESPLKTLLSGGTAFLSTKSIQAIICDQEMDVEEQTMFHILNTWVKQDEGNIEAGKALVSNIRLSYIKMDYLKNVVNKCGFVELVDVEAALEEIEEMMANQSPDDNEHVLVEGAGNDEINGIYVRMDEDIGLGEEEVMYVKEAQEDEYSPDYGLYLLRSTWAITSCVDYSNVLYECQASKNATVLRHQAPKLGWTTVGGSDPPPKCTWNPSKDNTRSLSKGYVAPNLAESGTNQKTVMDIANGDHDEGHRRYTLRTMINLPIDEDFEEDDYHDDIDHGNV